MSSMALSDGEKSFYNSVPVFGTTQEALNAMNPKVNYESPAISSGDNIFMREKFPYNPTMTFGNIQKLPMWMTDKDALAHEMQHQFAGRTGRNDTEYQANIYKDEVAGRLSDKPDRVNSLRPDFVEEWKKKGYL
jgi:hypothetical protein